MERRKLGTSDLEVPPVVLGAWALGGGMWGGADESRALDAVRASVDAGIQAVDTAPVYGFGQSEEVVGRALRGRRDEVVVATKCGLRWDRDDGELRFVTVTPDGQRVPIHHNLRPDSIREECEASLRRLQTDRIDLYQIHWPDPRHPLEDALAELIRLRDEGKVRWLGVSNFPVELLEVARREGGIVSDQPQYNLLDRAIEEDVLPWCRERGLGILAYSPMARGLLTGKVPPDREFPETDHRSVLPWFAKEVRERVARALEAVSGLAEGHGVTVANLAVAWVHGTPGITAALTGARDAEQARENARAASLRLTGEEREQIRRAFEDLRAVASSKAPPASPRD